MRELKFRINSKEDGTFDIVDLTSNRKQNFIKNCYVRINASRDSSNYGSVKIYQSNSSRLLLDTDYRNLIVEGKTMISAINCSKMLDSIIRGQDAKLQKYLISSDDQEHIECKKLKLNPILNNIEGDETYDMEVYGDERGVLGFKRSATRERAKILKEKDFALSEVEELSQYNMKAEIKDNTFLINNSLLTGLTILDSFGNTETVTQFIKVDSGEERDILFNLSSNTIVKVPQIMIIKYISEL